MANIGGKDVGNNDLMVLGGGIVLLILSFFHWSGDKVCAKDGGVKRCVSGFGGVGGASGWNSGFLGWAGLLLILIGVVIVALRVFTTVTLPELPISQSMLVLVLTGLGTLFILLRLIFGYSGDVFGTHYTVSRGIVLYLATIVSLIITAGAFLAFTAGGGSISDFKSIGRKPDGTPPADPPVAPAV